MLDPAFEEEHSSNHKKFYDPKDTSQSVHFSQSKMVLADRARLTQDAMMVS